MGSSAMTTPNQGILWLQWIGGFGAMVNLFVNSLMKGWSSPYVAKLTAEDSPLPITLDEASWVASLLNLGRLGGAIAGALSVYFFGSKNTLLVSGFPSAFGSVMIIVANSVTWLYVARLTHGISMGVLYSSFPLYLGEISSPLIRGTLVTMALSGVNLGTLCGNIMGANVSMAVFSYVSLAPTLIFMLIFAWLPESPYDLTRKDKLEDAKKSIQRYNPNIDAKIEVIAIKEFISASNSITFMDKLREFNITRNRKAGLILVLLFFFMQSTGLNTVIFYMETILSNAKLSFIDPAMGVVIINTIGVLAGYFATYIADKFERRTLFIGSNAGACAAMITLGLHFMLIERGFDSSKLQWLPVVSLIAYQVFFSFGLGIIPNMVLGELFAPNIKSLAACLAGIATSLFGFASTKSYQPLVDAFGEAYAFWSHAVITFLAIVFALTLMPETKGKTLQEIQDNLTTK